jgi:hypothetical protein
LRLDVRPFFHWLLMLTPQRIGLLFVGWLAAGAASNCAADTDHQLKLDRLPPVAHSYGSVIPASVSETIQPSGNFYEASKPDSGQHAPWLFGEFRVRPYGAFWADMVYATQRTFPGAYSLFVFSEDDQDEAGFAIDARRSRFGLNVEGPSLAAFHGADSGGRVEIDFHGNFIVENRAAVLLRHAYWEVRDESFRLLVGQTWDVISPLYPGMVEYAPGFFGGNIGFRRTQFRAERHHELTDRLAVSLEASLNQDIVPDFPADPGIRREPSDWPVIEGRLAFTFASCGDDSDPAVVGVSGHIGETGFDFLTAGPPPLSLPPEDDVRFQTWSFNVDMYLPITERLGLQGEFFTGANLSAFLGGIGQGVCPCLRVPIRSTGGWLEAWYDWTPYLHSHVGAGLDDPRDNDSLLGRIYNHFIFANLIVDISDNLMTGIEVTSRKTLYHETRVGLIPLAQLTPSAPGEAVTIDWMVRYEF